MKKYSLIGLVWLCAIALGAIAWFLPITHGPINLFHKWSTSLLSYLPSSVDQMMMIDINPETIAFLRNSNQWFDETAFTTVLESLDHIVIAQAPKWADDVYSTLLLAGNDTFSIDQVQALWLLYFDTWYVTKQLTNNLWLYGDKDSVDYFATTTPSLSSLPEIKEVLKEAKQRASSVLFFSKPWAQLGNDPLTLAFANKIHYTALYGTPTTAASKWSFVIQLTWTNFTAPKQSFTPKYTNKLNDRTIVYLEAQNLLSSFWFDDTKFWLGVPLLLSQAFPWADTLLSTPQISSLYAAINKQLGIIIQTTEGMFGIGVHLHMWSPEVYDSLLALQPAWRSLARTFIGSWTIREDSTQDSWTLFAELPAANGMSWAQSMSFPLLTLQKDTTSTTLSLLSDDRSGGSIASDLLFTPDSLITFRYDPKPLLQMAGVNPLIGNIVGQMEILGTGALLGEVQLHASQQQLIATFETK